MNREQNIRAIIDTHFAGFSEEIRDSAIACIMTLKEQPCTDAISRSEAIRIASGYCHWTNIPDELEKLPSVNPKPCEDAISRKAVEAITWEEPSYTDALNALTEVREKIRTLPSVSTEKTGRWEWVPYDSNPNIGNWHCSECNRIVCGAITAASPVYSYKYCPKCGAKMGVEE